MEMEGARNTEMREGEDGLCAAYWRCNFCRSPNKMWRNRDSGKEGSTAGVYAPDTPAQERQKMETGRGERDGPRRRRRRRAKSSGAAVRDSREEALLSLPFRSDVHNQNFVTF